MRSGKDLIIITLLNVTKSHPSYEKKKKKKKKKKDVEKKLNNLNQKNQNITFEN